VLFQPLAFAGVLREAFIVGAVLSMFTPPIVTVATLPARSITVKVWLWFAPSLLNVNEPLSTPVSPDRSSLAVKLVSTLVLFQP
jgi:hypothetical protein